MITNSNSLIAGLNSGQYGFIVKKSNAKYLVKYP